MPGILGSFAGIPLVVGNFAGGTLAGDTLAGGILADADTPADTPAEGTHTPAGGTHTPVCCNLVHDDGDQIQTWNANIRLKST